MSQDLHARRGVLDGLDIASAVLFPVPPRIIPSTETISIENLQCIGSYNWQESENPTIIVPGSPRIWNESASLPTVPPDTENQIIDPNGLHIPKTPLLPIFLAVPSTFDWSSVDIVTDRNNLRKLLSWVQGRSEKFRIDVEFVGNTLLLGRWEERAVVRAFHESYGKGFERAATSVAEGCESAALGNHRIVSYEMGGMRLVVRSLVDACLPANSEHAQSFSSGDTTEPLLKVLRTGCIPPDTSILELSTRKKKGNGGWRQRYEKMFFGQTAAVYIAYHEDGKFKTVVKKTKEQLSYHEQNMQPDLRQLRQALVDIRALAKERTPKAFSMVRGVEKELKVYERKGETESCLPQTYLDLFTQK